MAVSLALSACGGKPLKPAPTAPVATGSPEATGTATPPSPVDLASLIGVEAALPTNDSIGLAARYRLTDGPSPASKPFAGEANLGDKRQFFVARLTGAALAQQEPPPVDAITATVLAKSEHAYFYVDDAVGGDPAAVAEAAAQFEASVWPTITNVFGPPAIPGVDDDPRIIVLQADLGGAAGGYYSGDDAYLRSVRRYSNEAEMLYIDRTIKPGGAAFNVVVAHEFHHLIHANNDRDEEAWVNEGISEDASGLAGGAMSSINSFAAKPETQLNAWASEGSAPHYGAGAAFFGYLAGRFGGDATLGAIEREQRDGTAGVDQFLQSIGQPLGFRDVFGDWIAANALNAESGPYTNPDRPVDLAIADELRLGDALDAQASQFGTDYYRLPELDGGAYALRFSGRTEVTVLPPAALAEGPVLWANAEDDIDTKLTYEIDLTGSTGAAVSFRTWYDIEHWFDWGYVSASTDGGNTWTALQAQDTESDDPVGAAYGPGFSGQSGGGDAPVWRDERIDLTPYAGKKIKLRFEYVTDGATHGQGWAVRDIALTAGGSPVALPQPTSEGWVLIDRQLTQTYVVRLIATRAGEPVVMDMPLDASRSGTLRFDSAGLQDVVLAIAGSTIGTEQPAPYSIELARP